LNVITRSAGTSACAETTWANSVGSTTIAARNSNVILLSQGQGSVVNLDFRPPWREMEALTLDIAAKIAGKQPVK
jgi:hypothetical protein